MNNQKIKIKIKRENYFEIIQKELIEYSFFINNNLHQNSYFDDILLLDIMSKMAFKLRDIIEKINRPKSMSLSIGEAVVLIKVFNYKKRDFKELESAVLQTIVSELQQEIFSRFNN